MNYSEVFVENATEPTGRIVDISDIACQAVLDAITAGDENLILLYIDVATDLIETATGTTLRAHDITAHFSNTEATQYNRRQFLKIPRYPMNSVTRVELWNGENFVETTGFNIVQKNVAFPRIEFQYDGLNDLVYFYDDEVKYPIRVVANVGFTTAPPALRLAIMQLVTALLDNRGDCACDDVQSVLGGIVGTTMSPYIVRDYFG